ncbi:hypothetical protein QVH35_01265 [Candidatus Nitrosotenuis chungbukensis]|uniref:hypothetical protein n=1 Tax=Candidatus Nitrosotenuis chungbukensis TaxID=1353246 RepID=UPI0005B26613|nr:hypothetical protein [Candidatus Nitrosotenuis chungbukensis]WKT58169.1 hypothetical protein QVH35_01265 [Candidatus Nitrosotenuis chungbukensis]
MSQHLKHKKFAITAAIIGVIAAGATGAYFIPAQTAPTTIPPTVQDIEEGKAVDIAQRFVRGESPTFTFDGIADTVDLVGVTAMPNPQEYEIVIQFTSAHGGFGNREGQMLTQALTPHEMRILISEGSVISAVIDETWDELNNQYVLKPQPKLPSHDSPVTPFEGEVTDYASLVEAIRSRGILVEHVEEIAAESSSFSVPTQVISVGGADVQVFEFQSESDAQASGLTVSDDGTEIGTSIIHWIDTPHFYTKGKLIVLYVGQNPEMTNLLESLLGTQFAGM